MKPNVWPKINEIHQRWLTHEATIELMHDILSTIISEKDVIKNNNERINGTNYYSVQKYRSNTFKSTDGCISPRPQTPTSLYPSKSPRSPRRNLSIDYKKEINQTKTPKVAQSEDFTNKTPKSPLNLFNSEEFERDLKINQTKNNGQGDIIKEPVLTNSNPKRNQKVNSNQNKTKNIVISRFYFSKGKPFSFKEVDPVLNEYKEKLKKLILSDNTIPKSKLGEVTKILDIPYYWKCPFYLCCKGKDDKPLKLDDIMQCMKVMLTNCGNDESKFMFIMTKGGLRNFLERSDFEPLLRDILDTHPGLEFLQKSVDFHVHYISTVISRIFFNLDRNWDDKLSLQEISRSDLIWVLSYLEKHDDINVVTQYFSYEHFYVIYCKFWELDDDHDLVISRDDLARHNNYALSERVIDRIFEGTVLRKVPSDKTMQYTEFIWFLLSEEDKHHPRSIEYWFRIMDLDGDGILSIYELEYFYEEQLQRMEERGIEPVGFNDCLCMMLDMVHPISSTNEQQLESIIGVSLADLKACKQAPIFFDTFINLYKYLEHENGDPFNNQRDIEEGLKELSDWDRFAAETYEQLVLEDQQQVLGSSNEFDYDDDFESDENNGPKIYESEFDSKISYGHNFSDDR